MPLCKQNILTRLQILVFKKLFGEEVNKDLLIDFLNGLLPEKHKIKDLQYKKNDQLGDSAIGQEKLFLIFIAKVKTATGL